MKRGKRKQLQVDMGMADLGFAPWVMARALMQNRRMWKHVTNLVFVTKTDSIDGFACTVLSRKYLFLSFSFFVSILV